MNRPLKAALSSPRPNILFMMVDQLRYPRFCYGSDGGFLPAIKEILGFESGARGDNPFRAFFPGFSSLREHAAVFRRHTIAASACIPSRASIFTGQYGTRTGVTQTDGLFKDGDAAAFPWLSPDGIPTIGHWFRRAGYKTHYFGKCHFANPPDHSLDRFGFDDWELSYPEPHGSQPNNLGTYRDIGFADTAVGFLRRMALGLPYNRAVAQQAYDDPKGSPPPTEQPPWFAVVSFTNPHDIAAYPGLPRQLDPDAPKFGALPVPAQGAKSKVPTSGTLTIPLNPLGFPQDNANLPPNLRDSLENKPRCQFDYSYKIGLGLASKAGLIAAQQTPIDAVEATLMSAIPFQLTKDPDDAVLKFIQYYTWLIQVVDGHIHRVLSTLDECGLRDDTIVVFLADHGEYGGSHSYMMEKWHAAYQEILHVPLVVQSSRFVRKPEPRYIDALTSHIDIVPTLLGLAGITEAEIEQIRTDLRLHRPVPPFVGADLSPLVRGKSDEVLDPDGKKREGVLFITDDEITMPLPPDGDPHQEHSAAQFKVFVDTVEAVRTGDAKVMHLLRERAVPRLAPGAVRQPNHVRCVRTDRWKLIRTWDPSGEHADEWELYDLEADPIEMHNLLVFDGAFPTVVSNLPAGLAHAEVEAAARSTHALLTRYEREKLSPWPSAS